MSPNFETFQRPRSGYRHFPMFRKCDGGADISTDGLYRYRLWRRWRDGVSGSLTFAMLNPSTADADTDDATIRRCIGFADRTGFCGIDVVNLYALRATKPIHLLDHPDPEGPENTMAWRKVLGLNPGFAVVAAWGNGRQLPGLPSSRALVQAAARTRFVCLGTTILGEPCHPLRLATETRFETFDWSGIDR